LEYSFLIRAMYYEDDKLELAQDHVNLGQLLLDFYREWEISLNRLEGEETTYNLHVFSHSLETRLGPSYKTSAERFESSYFNIKKLFMAGTRNIPKQLLWKYMLRDLFAHHCNMDWSMIIKVSGSERTKAEDNSIISFKEEGKLAFGRVKEHCPNNTWFNVTRLKTAISDF
jgi:hypothetical protein